MTASSSGDRYLGADPVVTTPTRWQTPAPGPDFSPGGTVISPPPYIPAGRPAPGPRRRGGAMAAWVSVSLAVAVAITAAVTAVVVRDHIQGAVGSAHDTAPVTVVIDEPTCGSWGSIAMPLSATGQESGFRDRDVSIPETDWTPQLRKQYDTERTAIDNAADRVDVLAKQTPHRVVREIYDQLIAYWRAYTGRIAHYSARDDQLLRVTYALGDTIFALCDAIRYGAAALRGPFADTPSPPTRALQPSANAVRRQRFLMERSNTCANFRSAFSDFNKATSAWHHDHDPDTPATKWNAQQKTLSDATGRTLNDFDNQITHLGRGSGNPSLEDFAVLAAVYGQSYVRALPTFRPSDEHLFDVTAFATSVIASACKEADGI